MSASDLPRTASTELFRWVREPGVQLAVALMIVVSAALAYLAVSVAAGSTSSGSAGLQLQTNTVLTADSTNEHLASMARGSLTMFVPIAAIVLGAQFAGGEMRSGALLQIGVAARRVRYVFAVRLALVALIAGGAGAIGAVATLAATDAAGAQTAELSQLTVWDAEGAVVAGAAVQALVIALLAFGLSALTRRWLVVVVCMVIYFVAVEPVVAGLFTEAGVWLPRAATTELMLPEPALAHVLPTVVCALLLVALALDSLRRDRVVR